MVRLDPTPTANPHAKQVVRLDDDDDDDDDDELQAALRLSLQPSHSQPSHSQPDDELQAALRLSLQPSHSQQGPAANGPAVDGPSVKGGGVLELEDEDVELDDEEVC